MQNQSNFTNESFQDRVEWLRANIANAAFFIVALSYIGAAVAIGTFVTKLLIPAFGVTAANVMGYGLAFGAQLGRGTVLFFGQGNPIRVHVHRYNWTIAVVMGLFSIWEVWHLVDAASIHVAAFWSFAGAMIIGVIIEIMLAAEIDRFTKLELFRNRDAWQELREYHQGERQFKAFLRDIKRGPIEAPTLPDRTPQAQAWTPQDENSELAAETEKQVAEARALVEGENLHRVKITPDLDAQTRYEKAAETLETFDPGNAHSPNGQNLNGQHPNANKYHQ